MRSSVFFLGSIIGRFKRAYIPYPGGCKIGERKVNYHMKAFGQMNIECTSTDENISCETNEIRGATICLDCPSVGATENIMLAGVFAKGDTEIINAAREPEIVDLQNFLNAMGADISGAGTNVIHISCVKKLRDAEYTVIPDRIEAGTYLIAGAITGGEVNVTRVDPTVLTPLTNLLTETGCDLKISKDSILISAAKKILAPQIIFTQPYPNFPTDLQPQMMALLSLAKGRSIIIETIFDKRFNHVAELNLLGADITFDSQVALINGVEKLTGTVVTATDLRAGAALILAGLAAKGTTVVKESAYVERGYVNIEGKLRALGADIEFACLK